MSCDCVVCKWYESTSLYIDDLNGRCLLCYNAFISLHGDKIIQKYTSFLVTTTWENAQIPPIIRNSLGPQTKVILKHGWELHCNFMLFYAPLYDSMRNQHRLQNAFQLFRYSHFTVRRRDCCSLTSIAR